MPEQLILRRRLGKKTGDDKIEAQVDYIIRRGLHGSRGKGWEVNKRRHPPRKNGDWWEFRYDLSFEKTGGRGRGTDTEYRQWEDIKAMIIQQGAAAKFGDYPWEIFKPTGEAIGTTAENIRAAQQEVRTNNALANLGGAPQLTAPPPPAPDNAVTPDANAESIGDVVGELNKIVTSLGGVREVQTTFSVVKSWSDLQIPPELLGRDSDFHLSQHPAWAELYGVGAQIRTVLSNIKRAHDTDGRSRNHGVLYGHAGCGKTTTLLALEAMFGPGSVLRLDATSTTRAGIEKLFFSDLPVIPPLVFMEEAEKADPEALKVWLGALDDRGEIRKVNFRVNQLREVKVLFICTVNNKTLFDKMMGSDGSEAGALSSRCVSQIYFPRPSDVVLRQILLKEVHRNGGEEAWINPCILMAQELGVTDPRIVRSYLAGGERLLDGSYQRDWQAIAEAAKTFRK
jgi:hypothetical protein